MIFSSFAELQKHLFLSRKNSKKIGFVPTMGTLHKGHLSLVETAKKQCETVVVSLFVNPTQFENANDFALYPQNFLEDIEKLKNFEDIVILIPSVEEVYGENGKNDGNFSAEKEKMVLPKMFGKWEGEIRKGHFEGVFLVLKQFFQKISPDIVFFGQKDFQQTLLVSHLLLENFPKIQMQICPIVREKSGLAMSSRNNRLCEKSRNAAKILFSSLEKTVKHWENGEKNTEILEEFFIKTISDVKNFETDEDFGFLEKIFYAKIVDEKTLEEKKIVENGNVFLLSVQWNGVRLLDNIVFG